MSTAVRLPKADLVIQSEVDPSDVLAISIFDYGRKLRVNAMRNMRTVCGASFKRSQVADLIQGLSDLHANMPPEA
jgi:hypothetical protein